MGRAAKLRSVVVHKARANAGLINDIVDMCIDRWVEGEDFDTVLGAFQNEVANQALNAHGERVRSGLARAGLALPDGPITAQGIADAINDKSGLNISDFSPEGIMQAVDSMLAKRITEVTGIQITSVIGASITDQLKAGVRLALRSGQAKKLLGIVMEKRARQLATLKRLGSDQAELKRLRNRAYQANWRKTHKLVWE